MKINFLEGVNFFGCKQFFFKYIFYLFYMHIYVYFIFLKNKLINKCLLKKPKLIENLLKF